MAMALGPEYMKKTLSMALLLVCSFCLFIACEDDNDSNPTLIQPTEFVLNEPAYSGETIDLAHSDSLGLSWSQPVYTTDNAPVVVTYEIQISTTGTFTTSTVEAAADESGETVADYYVIEETTTSCTANISASEVAAALTTLEGYTEEETPDTQVIYICVNASVSGYYPIESNVVQLTVVPYYVELGDADIEMWYLIGSCIGDGTWSNSSAANVGVSIIPMSIVEDYTYDSKGQGELTYTGYLTTDGFKLIQVIGSWDAQWGSSDGGTTGVKNDGGSSNICVPSNGYYTITLNTSTDELSIVAADITPTIYSTMLISGDFNSWGSETMTAVNTATSEYNHIWTYTLNTPDGDTTCKFLQDGWSPNWGAEGFPYGIGVSNGANIPITAGNWVITFNDIDGSYQFTSLD